MASCSRRPRPSVFPLSAVAVLAPAPRGDVGQGEDPDGEAHHRGDHHHHRTERVGHERDPERRVPAAERGGDDAVLEHDAEQTDGDDEEGDERGDAQSPGQSGPVADQRGEHRRRQGDQDRGDEEVAHGSPPSGGPSSSPNGVPGGGSATRISSVFTVPRSA